MPRTRETTIARRIWVIVAMFLTGSLHVYVLERLINLNPQPAPPKPARPLLPEQWVYEFEAPVVIPAPPDPPQATTATPPAASPIVRKRDTVRSAAPAATMPMAAATEQYEYQPAPTTAADLLRQIPYAAGQVLPSETERRSWLDLSVQAENGSAPIKPERRSAGLGGAPTRSDVAPVGDLANGLLIEQWHGMHHPQEARDCSKQARGEPLSVYLGRCKQGL